MVGIQGIGGVAEPNRSDRSSSARDNTKAPSTSEESSSTDDVVISGEAQAAAKVAQAITASATQSDIRADKVAAAKESIERGDYKKPEVVESVAQRIAKYL
jgi:anti-sigma28 factor (negative regulator of flagellin synthesis)